MNYIILILSFLLDGILSFFLNKNLLLNPLFSLCSLIIIYRYYSKSMQTNYLITCSILGLFFDIVYSDTIFLNAGIFLLLGLFITKYYQIFSYKLLSSTILTILIIILYRLITFLVLSNLGIINFNLYNLFRSIYSSIFINIIYVGLYFLKKRKYKRYLQA